MTYMDSRSSYDGEQWWDEQGYETSQYDNQNYYEEPHSTPSHNIPYYYEESYSTSLSNGPYHYEESLMMPEYAMSHYYEDPNSPRASSMYQNQSPYYRPEEDERQESEPPLASVIAQLVAYQAQETANQALMQKYTQVILQQLDELKAQTKMLETQIAQQASLELKEQEIEDEEEYREPPPYVPPIPFPQRLKRKILEDQVRAKEDIKRTLAKVDGREETNQRYTSSSINEEEQVSNDSPNEDDFFNEYSYMREMFDEEQGDSSHLPPSNHNVLLDRQVELEVIELQKDERHQDLVDTSMDQFREEPCLEVDTRSKDYLEDFAPKAIIEKLEESVPKLEDSFEDPFLITSPPNKFMSFQPFIAKQLDRSSNNPLVPKVIIYKRKLSRKRKVHSRLDGRKLKWDLKVD